MDEEFAAAIRAAEHDIGCKGIGTLGEKSLHLALKYYFAPDPETHERRLGGYIADAVTEEGVIEIQTRSLTRLKPKLEAFLPLCPVTVVYPIAEQKQLIRVNEYGELLTKRRSPKHETVFTAMREIYTLREYLTDPNLRLCICGLEIAEYTVQANPRRKLKLDRVPIALRRLWMLESPADYAAILPHGTPQKFTVSDIVSVTHAAEMHARMYVNLLARLGCITEIEKRGHAKQWRMNEHYTPAEP